MNKYGRLVLALALSLMLVIGSMSFGFAGISENPNIQIVKLTDIPNIKVGHWTSPGYQTGTSVIIYDSPDGASGGVSQMGGSPASRETDLLNPTKTVQILNAVVLSGGSAFGLDTAGGVMRYLNDKGIGVPVGGTMRVPIVPTACVFDLGRGLSSIPGNANNPSQFRPGVPEGFKAAQAAFAFPEGGEWIHDALTGNAELVKGWTDGNTGGGMGANSGGMKGGFGSFCYKFGDLYVGAAVVVNSAGQVIDPTTGTIITGSISGRNLANGQNGTLQWREPARLPNTPPSLASTAAALARDTGVENTTIGLIVTNAKLTKSEANALATLANDGYARAIYPTHTPSDGDTIFAMATNQVSTGQTTWGQESANINLIAVLAVNAMERAIISAVYNAESVGTTNGHATMRLDGTLPAQPAPLGTVSALDDVLSSPSLRPGFDLAPFQQFLSDAKIDNFVVDALSTASLDNVDAEKNDLTITITELYADGTEKVIKKTFRIDFSAKELYKVEGYNVYVATDDEHILECYVVW
jgi:L-aminopeptidase/D-esterase-like protein